jgi:hypothetical protein
MRGRAADDEDFSKRPAVNVVAGGAMMVRATTYSTAPLAITKSAGPIGPAPSTLRPGFGRLQQRADA